ncbi:MAG: Gfo/Idh/MocA family oxidoreductase [Planctomycetota bacterium]
MRAYRFAVIGFGSRGVHHTKMIEASLRPRAVCAAVCDVRKPTPEERRRFGDRFYRDHRGLLRKEKDLDFVLVTSQEAQHVEHALAVLRRGIPVYLEKAVSNTWKGAVRLYREVVRQSYPLFIGYNLRRFPAARVTETLLRSQRIGRVQSVLAHVNTGNEFGAGVFLQQYCRDAHLSGDIVLSKLTHDTEWIQYILETTAETCTAVATRNVWTLPPHPTLDRKLLQEVSPSLPKPTSHDTCAMTGLFANGSVFTFVFTTAGPDYERRYVFSGTKGQIETILHTRRPGAREASVVLWPYKGKPRHVNVPSGRGSHGGGDEGVHRDFFRWLATHPRAPREPHSILLGMLVPTAALQSARTGRQIDCAQRMRKALGTV